MEVSVFCFDFMQIVKYRSINVSSLWKLLLCARKRPTCLGWHTWAIKQRTHRCWIWTSDV